MHLDTPLGVANPEYATGVCPSSICSTSAKPLLMTGVMLWLLRSHFRVTTEVREEQLRSYKWDEDDQVSKILIESATLWNPRNLQQRPALMVKRNEWKVSNNITLANRMPNATIINDGSLFNGESYEVMLNGSHTVFCIGGTGAEAEILAAETFLQLLEFAPSIREDFNMHRFVVDGLAAVSRLDESHEHWVVPVNVAYAVSHNWILRPVGPLLKGMSVETTI